MIYGYARVSTVDQNLDRQLELLRNIVTDERNIITDKASGKTFDRKGYNSLVGTNSNAPMLREGDLLVIVSIDRLGRNYTEIREQWQYITCTLKADIKVLDMPLLDTSKSNNSLDGKFIADLVLQILSYTAEKERENIRKRQRQGIDTAKANGKYLGRPKIEYPQEWECVYSEWKQGKITATKAMQMLNLKRTTFYKLVKMYTSKNPY
jgi:DNA invertase Pin-like site-specific DNA recombinase